jgi:hypothetical protein
MRGRRKCISTARLTTASLLMLLVTVGMTASSAEPGDEREGVPTPQLVRLNWAELRQPQQVVTASTLELVVENSGSFPLTARVHAGADNGTTAPPATLMLQNVEIPTGQLRRLSVPIAPLRQSDSLRRRSGGLRATVLACFTTAAAGSDCQSISAPEWFMHVDSAGVLRIYDAATLKKVYRSGDLSMAGLPGETVRDGDEIANPNRVIGWINQVAALPTPPGDGPTAPEEGQ